MANSSDCLQFNDSVLSWLAENDHEVQTVFLAARWALLAPGATIHGEGNSGLPILAARDLRDSNLGDQSVSNLRLLRVGLDATVMRLRDAGLDVVILGNVPEIGWDVPKLLTLNAWRNDVSLPPTPTLWQVQQRNSRVDDTLREIASQYGATFIPLAPLLCQPMCILTENGRPVYVDGHHLSRHGARSVVGPRLVEIFR
jgi:hypothetical protein